MGRRRLHSAGSVASPGVGVQEAASYVNGVTITVDGGFSAALTLPEPTAKL